jgi:Mlc titration factor MtfA (ptsG expression regulator)
MRVRVAARACVPVLELGLDYYSRFKGIVLYPGDFRVHEQRMDEAGVVHEEIRELCGQSLAQGPMVLSWGTIIAERAAQGQDLVIHECAHKLDTLNGEADGFPPLHAGMSPRTWTRALRVAYDKLCDDVDAGRPTRLDSYAAEDPAEFFAVASETFFTRPDVVFEDFPDVYAQLAAFYKQDPRLVLNRGAER